MKIFYKNNCIIIKFLLYYICKCYPHWVASIVFRRYILLVGVFFLVTINNDYQNYNYLKKNIFVHCIITLLYRITFLNPQRRRKVGQHDASPIQVTVIYYNGYIFICKRFNTHRQNKPKFDIISCNFGKLVIYCICKYYYR